MFCALSCYCPKQVLCNKHFLVKYWHFYWKLKLLSWFMYILILWVKTFTNAKEKWRHSFNIESVQANWSFQHSQENRGKWKIIWQFQTKRLASISSKLYGLLTCWNVNLNLKVYKLVEMIYKFQENSWLSISSKLYCLLIP